MGGFLVGWVLGAAWQLQQPALWPWAANALSVALGLSGCAAAWRWNACRVSPVLRTLAWLLCAAALSFGLTGLRAGARMAQALDPALEGRDLVVTGVIDALPVRTEWGQRLRLRVESAGLAGRTVRLPPRVQLAWPQAAGAPEGGEDLPARVPTLRAGDRWELAVRLKAPHGPANPHGFDAELWLWEQGLQATGSVRTGAAAPAPRWLGDSGSDRLERLRQSMRDRLFASVEDPGRAGVLAALAMGDQQAIGRAGWDLFRATGVAHLMSISGLHVTLFAWAAAAVLRVLWRRSPRLCLAWPAAHAALAGGVLLAAGYALFSGWGVPAQRTVLMLSAVAALRLAGLHWPWPQVWLLAAAVVVAADPWALAQAGFWLSFVAVGVLFATTPDGPDAPYGRPAPAGAAARARALVREQWIVTLALAPLTLWLFGQVSLVGLAANLVAIPWVTLVVTPLSLAGVLAPPLWDVGGWAVQALVGVLGWLGSWPGAVLALPVAPAPVAALGMLGALLMVLRLPPVLRALGLLLFVPMLSWPAARPVPGQFELLAVDVGQGNAVLVRTAGHTLLYDAGPRYGPDSDAGGRIVVPLLQALGERVDLLLVSHRDSDHSGGAGAVLAHDARTRLLSSLETGHPLRDVAPHERCIAGQRWRWDGVDFELLHPLAQDYARAGLKPNALSCVLRVQAAGAPQAVALLVGDIEAAQELALVAREDRLRADWLLVPHHGSRTSSSGAFLDAVAPTLALVQAGYRNRYGHPAEAVAARYEARGIRLLRSPACGAAGWHSAEPARIDCRRVTHRRYWQHPGAAAP